MHNMKTKLFFLFALCTLCACKTYVNPPCGCKDTHKPSDLPWLNEILTTKVSTFGADLVSVDKVYYREAADDNTLSIGILVEYEPMCCDISGQFLYDCDGNLVTEYGGVAGCIGQCDIAVISRENIFKAKQ